MARKGKAGVPENECGVRMNCYCWGVIAEYLKMAEKHATEQQRACAAEAKLAEALEDARASRRDRDDAVRERDEMDTDAQHRAERYCHEKRLAERERGELRAKLPEAVPERRWYGEVSWGWCPGWSSCTPLYTTRDAAETCLRERVAGPDDAAYEMRVCECNVVKTYPVEKRGA